MENPTVGQIGLGALDWAIIFVYAAATIGLGYYYSLKQRDVREYFIGSGRMNPLLVGVSLFATLLSTISYLAVPGEVISKGPAIIFIGVLAAPLAYLMVSRLLLGVYMRQKVTSAYELLEQRLGLGIRMLGASMFLLLRLIWMSLLVYIAASAMTVMMGVGEDWIPYIVLATGFVSVIYTSLGGLGAVVITDFLQTVLLMGGALLVITLVTVSLDGFSWFPTVWQPTWDAQPLYSLDPRIRVTVVGSLLSVLTWQLCTAGGDQVSIQRFMATGDARSARRAYLTKTLVGATVSLLLILVGFSLLGYFTLKPDELPAGLNLAADGDKIFPRFVAFHLPPGVSGLVVAAMFAAAMSSIDSGVNSITAVVMTDFLGRFGRTPATARGQMRLARLLAFSVGATVVVGSSFMEHVPGNFIAISQRSDNLLVAPLFGLFFFALFVPFARPLGVLVGTVYGVSTAGLIAFSGSVYEAMQGMSFFGVSTIQTTAISFQWVIPVSLLVNLTAGTAACWLLQAPMGGSRSWKLILVLLPLPVLVGVIVLWPWIDAAYLGL